MKRSTEFLTFLAGFICPKIYLEIGLNLCQTFNRLALLSEMSIGVDPNPDCVDCLSVDSATIHTMTSDDFFRSFSNELRGKLDLVFIDGLHTKEQVERDFNSSLPLLNSNGWIVLHDTYPPGREYTTSRYCGDVWEFADKLKTELDYTRYELITFPWCFGLTGIHKYEHPLRQG